MGKHDCKKAKLIAQETDILERLMRQIIPGENNTATLQGIAEANERIAAARQLQDHRYWCDFCHKSFRSKARQIIGLRFIYDHDDEGMPKKHHLDGMVLVACPGCKTNFNLPEMASQEPD